MNNFQEEKEIFQKEIGERFGIKIQNLWVKVKNLWDILVIKKLEKGNFLKRKVDSNV